MAVGLVCHYRSDRLQLPSSAIAGNVTTSARSVFHSGREPMAKRPSRDAGGVDHHPSHTRLPSFSNFLSGAGQVELTSPPRFTGATVHSSASPAYGRGAVLPDAERYSRPPSSSSQINSIFSERHSIQSSSPRYEPAGQLSSYWDQASAPYERHSTASLPSFIPITHQPTPSHVHPYAASMSPEAAHGRIVVGEDVVPGKGPCYIYDDGTVCQKTINGDMVNPKWGTTKAGKPRKRLGQACNTCREKKIKCDPSVPKCAQCQKFNRDCKFETNTRTVQKNSNAASVREVSVESDTNQEKMHSRAGSTPLAETPHDSTYVSGGSRSSMNLENLLSPSSVEDVDHASYTNKQRSPKRQRFSTTPVENNLPDLSDPEINNSSESKTSIITTRVDNIFSIQSDPFDVDSEISSYYLRKYFANINVATFYIFPAKSFMLWAQHAKDKSQWDKMLLYAMMAAGANSVKKSDECKRFADIAEAAIVQSAGVFELQLVQTRLILSLLYFALKQKVKAWEFCGSAVRTAYGARLNTEEEKPTFGASNQALLGLGISMLGECKRRTLWAAYVMDCLYGCYPGYISSMQISDCFVRLPCADGNFEDGLIPDLPLFDGTEFDLNKQLGAKFSSAGTMAFVIQIWTILNQIITQVNRPCLDEPQAYETRQEIFYQEKLASLQKWDRAIRQHLNLDRIDTRAGPADWSSTQDTGLHMLYHYAAMLLCRYVRFRKLSAAQVARNCKKAHLHARRILELMFRINNREEVPEVSGVLSSPLTSHIILTAMDVITAGGSMSNLVANELGQGSGQQTIIGLVFGGIEALEGLAESWIPAKDQIVLARRRAQPLLLASESPTSRQKTAFFAQKPLLEAFELDLDIIYGLPRLEYIRALGYTAVRSENDLYEL